MPYFLAGWAHTRIYSKLKSQTGRKIHFKCNLVHKFHMIDGKRTAIFQTIKICKSNRKKRHEYIGHHMISELELELVDLNCYKDINIIHYYQNNWSDL